MRATRLFLFIITFLIRLLLTSPVQSHSKGLNIKINPIYSVAVASAFLLFESKPTSEKMQRNAADI